jgi:hypothetical protein
MITLKMTGFSPLIIEQRQNRELAIVQLAMVNILVKILGYITKLIVNEKFS